MPVKFEKRPHVELKKLARERKIKRFSVVPKEVLVACLRQRKQNPDKIKAHRFKGHLKQNELLCVKCNKRVKVDKKDKIEGVMTSKNGTRHYMKAKCPKCDTLMYKFIKKKDAAISQLNLPAHLPKLIRQKGYYDKDTSNRPLE